MKAHLKASMTTRFSPWYAVAANRRGFMGHAVIVDA
jgi:hypothetical protein